MMKNDIHKMDLEAAELQFINLSKYTLSTQPVYSLQTLRPITVDDVGGEESSQDATANNNQDPLVNIVINAVIEIVVLSLQIKNLFSIAIYSQLNMLMRLQEAANYSGNQSQDSDNASMDSNLTHDSSMGNEL